MKEFSKNFRTWAELAEIINSLPDDVKNQPVMFGDVRGDDEREAFFVSEIGTVNSDSLYYDPRERTPGEAFVKTGTLMLFG